MPRCSNLSKVTVKVPVPVIIPVGIISLQKPCQTHQIILSSRKMMKNFDREKLSK